MKRLPYKTCTVLKIERDSSYDTNLAVLDALPTMLLSLIVHAPYALNGQWVSHLKCVYL